MNKLGLALAATAGLGACKEHCDLTSSDAYREVTNSGQVDVLCGEVETDALYCLKQESDASDELAIRSCTDWNNYSEAERSDFMSSTLASGYDCGVSACDPYDCQDKPYGEPVMAWSSMNLNDGNLGAVNINKVVV